MLCGASSKNSGFLQLFVRDLTQRAGRAKENKSDGNLIYFFFASYMSCLQVIIHGAVVCKESG